MYMSHGSTECLVGLISLAAGYLVLVKAVKETKALKVLGIIIGTIIIAGTLLHGACKMMACAKYGTCGMKESKTMMGGPSGCPVIPEGKK